MVTRADSPSFRAEVPRWMCPAGGVLALAGLVAAGVGFSGSGLAGWQGLVVAFVYFSGLAQGMLLWSAVFFTAKATWSAAISRISQAAATVLPVTLVLAVVLLLGREHWLTWIHHPVEAKAGWLNEPFLIARVLVGLVAITALSGLFVWLLRRYDGRLCEGAAADLHRAVYRLSCVSVALCLAYVVVYTIIALDFAMSLSPHWFSTMFPFHFFVSSLYIGMAAIVLFATAFGEKLGAGKWLTEQQYQDMGNLLLGFSLFCTGLQFAQLLTVWYESLPEEAPFMIKRVYEWPWRPLSLLVLIGAYLGPFAMMLSPRVKRRPKLLSAVSALILVCIFIERLVMVAPSWDEIAPMLWPVATGLTLGLVGLLVLGVAQFMRRVPTASVVELRLHEVVREVEGA